MADLDEVRAFAEPAKDFSVAVTLELAAPALAAHATLLSRIELARHQSKPLAVVPDLEDLSVEFDRAFRVVRPLTDRPWPAVKHGSLTGEVIAKWAL